MKIVRRITPVHLPFCFHKALNDSQSQCSLSLFQYIYSVNNIIFYHFITYDLYRTSSELYIIAFWCYFILVSFSIIFFSYHFCVSYLDLGTMVDSYLYMFPMSQVVFSPFIHLQKHYYNFMRTINKCNLDYNRFIYKYSRKPSYFSEIKKR